MASTLRRAAGLLLVAALPACLIGFQTGSMKMGDVTPHGFALFQRSPLWADLERPYKAELVPVSGTWRHSLGLRVAQAASLTLKVDHAGPDDALDVQVFNRKSEQVAASAAREVRLEQAEPGEYVVVVARRKEHQEPREFALLATVDPAGH